MGRRSRLGGAGWEARRAAGGSVRPETAAEATGRPPGKSLGASCSGPIYWRLSRLDRAERDKAQAGGAAGWNCPCTGGAQINRDWRVARRTMGARQAGSSDSLTPFKPLETGERRGVHWRRGRLGAAIHCRRPKQRGSGTGLKLKTLFPQRTTPVFFWTPIPPFLSNT